MVNNMEYTSMTGAWVLDLSRSDTLEGYLRCLGISEGTIRAQVTAEREYQSRNVIALDERTLIIHKDTAVNNFTDRFELDREHFTPRRTIYGNVGEGTNQTMASLGDAGYVDGYVVTTTTCGPSGRPSQKTVEARQLIEGGTSHMQEINVRNLTTGMHCAVMRTWVRVAMTQEDHIQMAFN